MHVSHRTGTGDGGPPAPGTLARTTSLSRTIARWARATGAADLPPAVIDKVKALTLTGLVSAVLGEADPAARRVTAMLRREEGHEEGTAGRTPTSATVLVQGWRATKAGAAYANAELIHAGGRLDVYRMLTHPGTTILPAALVMAETQGRSGAESLRAIALGYEAHARIAGDWIPSVQARGFRSSPIFGIFGGAVAAGVLLDLDEDQLTSAIALCVDLAAGNLEGARQRARSLVVHEPSAARNAVLATLLAQTGITGCDTALEGEAGFYHAYAGSSRGELTHAFEPSHRADPGSVVAGLGTQWRMLDTALRTHVVAGYNLAVVDLVGRLCVEHDILAEDVERVDVELNEIEATYPSPAYPPTPAAGGPNDTAYCCAVSILHGGYPLDRDRSSPAAAPDDPRLLAELMSRVSVEPDPGRALATPRVRIHTVGGNRYSRTATGREFLLGFDQASTILGELARVTPRLEPRFPALLAAVESMERDPDTAALVGSTLLAPRKER